MSLKSIEAAPGGVVWRGTVAGVVVAIAALLVLCLFGLSVAVSQLDGQTVPVWLGRGMGGSVACSLLLAFMLGGYVAARVTGLRDTRAAIWRGALVFLLASPLLLVCAVPPGVLVFAGALLRAYSPDALAQVRDATWLALLGCLLGLTGSMFGGLLAASRHTRRHPAAQPRAVPDIARESAA